MKRVIIFFLMLASVLTPISFGDNIEGLEKIQVSAISKQSELAEVQSEQASVESVYLATLEEIETLKEKINETTVKIKSKKEEIKTIEEKFEIATEEYNLQAEEFDGRLRVIYLTKDESFWNMIFQAKDLDDLITRVVYYKHIVKLDEEIFEKLTEQKIVLGNIQTALKVEIDELELLKEQQNADKEVLDKKATELENEKMN